MKKLIIFLLSIVFFPSQAQVRTSKVLTTQQKDLKTKSVQSNNNLKTIESSTKRGDSLSINRRQSQVYDTIPSIDKYLLVDLYDNKVAIDTTLNIQSYYKHNFLQKDAFGLLAFGNDGMSYNILDYTVTNSTLFPTLGVQAKQLAFLNVNDISYFNVPTPTSKVFYRSGIKQGQNLDAFLTSNFNERTNFFVGYRGLRSLGAYINELSSIGNFKLGGSYSSKNDRYHLKTHAVVQDFTQQENGGILELELFRIKEGNREGLDVRLRDAKTLFKNTRLFADHSFQLNTSDEQKVWIKHQINYNYYTKLYTQPSAVSNNLLDSYFGDFYSSDVRDRLRLNTLLNKVDIEFDSKKLGQLSGFVSAYQYNYIFNSIVNTSEGSIVPNQLQDYVLNVGGSYVLKTKWLDVLLYASQSISEKKYSDYKAETNFQINDEISLDLLYQYSSKLPDFTTQLYQSDFVHYNWINDFSNEKAHEVSARLNNPFVNLSGVYKIITDKIYFSNDWSLSDEYGMATRLMVSPKQYSGTLNYLSLKAQKEFKWRKWALDNTIQFQQVVQEDDILNVPTFIARNSIYYSDYLFKNALFLQGGITSNYFTNYYMNGYNPVLGDYYVQNTTKIGNYPMIDVFLNMKIQTFRLYVAVEQVNHLVMKSKHFSAPGYPYRDLTLRLGLTWNFFN